jgi:hypothetical protein
MSTMAASCRNVGSGCLEESLRVRGMAPSCGSRLVVLRRQVAVSVFRRNGGAVQDCSQIASTSGSGSTSVRQRPPLSATLAAVLATAGFSGGGAVVWQHRPGGPPDLVEQQRDPVIAIALLEAGPRQSRHSR